MTYDIDRNMVNHTPDAETQKQMEVLRTQFHAVTDALLHIVPDGRERSLALTKLEEALMWSMAALARRSYDFKDLDVVKDVNELSGKAHGRSRSMPS